MRRLTIEITQAPRDPQKIKVRLSNQEGAIAGAEQETTLPWEDEFALPIVLKVLDKPSYSPELFNDQERNWLLQNQFASEYKGNYYIEEDLQKTIGECLYHTLIGGPLEEHYKLASEEAKQADEPLHLEIKFGREAGLIGAYPWELLYDGVDFLCRGGACLLTRYIMEDMEDRSTAPTRSVPERLKILVVSPRPHTPDVEKLDNMEPAAVIQAFKDFKWDRSVEVEVLQPPTFSHLIDYLQANRGEAMPHILHFDGHGVFGRRCSSCGEVETSVEATECQCGHPLRDPRRTSQGFLVFENEHGGSIYVSGEQLAEQLRMATVMSRGAGVPSEGLCLAMLSACESAFVQGKSVFNGVAQRLMHARIPAVVAMQFTVTENDALEFVNTFYQNIAESQPLVKAVLGGRSKLLGVKTDQWYRPVLYLRWREHEGGRLFDIGPAIRYPGGPEWFIDKTKRLEHDEDKAKIALDQIAVVTDFVKMLIPEWRKNIDWRILLLEGQEKTGKTTALKRFGWCCKKVQETVPILFTRIDLNNWVSESQTDLAKEIVQNLITSVEDQPVLDAETEKLRTLLNRLDSQDRGKTSGTSKQDPQGYGKEFYKLLNESSQKFSAFLLLDNFDALFSVDSGQWLKSFLLEMAKGVKDAQFPNCIFAAVTSTKSLRSVPDVVGSPEKTIDIVVGKSKYHKPVSQIGVEEVRDLAKEEFGIVITDIDRARELIGLAREFPGPEVQTLRILLKSDLLRKSLPGGG